MLDFENTQIAFASKSNATLRKSKILFSLVARPWMVKIGKQITKAAIAIRFPMKPFVKPTVFQLFCGGETIDECDVKIKELKKYNIGSILDYSVEGSNEEELFNLTTEKIIETIHKGKDQSGIPFAVFKVTGIAPDKLLEKVSHHKDLLSSDDLKSWERVRSRVNQICKAGFDHDVPVFVDAEDYAFQNAIDELTWEMMLKYNQKQAIVFNTIQAYRKDRFRFLKVMHEKSKNAGIHYGVKLVRGAYMEKERARAKKQDYPSPIHESKADTDNCFNDCLKYIVHHIQDFELCNGTHNEESTMLLTKIMEKQGLSKNDRRIFNAQLLGMSDHISFNLSYHGYNVAKYVPFGPIKHVVPYLIRRAEENTSASGQTGREMMLINKELRERKTRKSNQGVYIPKSQKQKSGVQHKKVAQQEKDFY